MANFQGNSGNAGATTTPKTGPAGQHEQQGGSSVVDKVRDTAATAWHKTEDVASNAADKVRDTAASAWHKTEEVAASAADKVKSAAHSVAHGAEDAYEATKDKAGELADNLTNLIRRNPVPAIFVGLGLGFLIGTMMSRR